MQVYFMRHGETNYNRLSLCNDDPAIDVHLTEKGRQQAEAAAEKLKSIPIQRIITSELPRTIETAIIINRYHQVPIDKQPAINDICSGFNGLPVADYQKAIAKNPLHLRINGGESLLDHKTRITGFLQWLKTQVHSCLLVVAHEETLRVISAHFQQLDDITMSQLSFDNCEIIHFTL